GCSKLGDLTRRRSVVLPFKPALQLRVLLEGRLVPLGGCGGLQGIQQVKRRVCVRWVRFEPASRERGAGVPLAVSRERQTLAGRRLEPSCTAGGGAEAVRGQHVD